MGAVRTSRQRENHDAMMDLNVDSQHVFNQWMDFHKNCMNILFAVGYIKIIWWNSHVQFYFIIILVGGGVRYREKVNP